MKKKYSHNIIDNYFKISSNFINNCSNFKTEIFSIVSEILKADKNKRKILVAGNGGSSSDADHFVCELTCTFDNRKRKAISAISLNNPTALSAWSNDFSYETFLERQIKALGKEKDLLFLLSTSGGDFKKKQSINLINALKEAKEKNIKIISFTGKSGGYLKNNSDINIHINCNETSIIQECHIALLHSICILIDGIKK